MKTTAAKFVSALFASVVATSTLTAAPETGETEKEKPADTCLLGPSASVPPGGHWYYRVDRVNKRNCWYLGEAKDKGARKPVTAAEEDFAATEKPVAPPPKKPATQRSITDARAELPLLQTPVQPDTKVVATQPDAGKAVTTRWPEPLAMSQSAPQPPAPGARVAETAPQTQAQVQPQVAPAAPSPPRPATSPASPSKANPAAAAPLSTPMLLTVLAGGLSVIGVMGSALFARGKSRRDKPRPRRRLSRSAPMPPLPTAEEPLPEKKPLPETSAPDDPSQRLQQMLAEIQKRAAA